MEDYHGELPVTWQLQPPAPRRRGQKWFLIGGIALALALTLGVGVIVGSALGSSPASAAGNTNQSQSAGFPGFAQSGPENGQRFAAGPGQGGQGPCVMVTVTSISGSTITAKAQDGSTITIHTTSSTTYTQNHQSASASAVKVGSVMSVMGTKNSDGSITATSIDIHG